MPLQADRWLTYSWQEEISDGFKSCVQVILLKKWPCLDDSLFFFVLMTLNQESWGWYKQGGGAFFTLGTSCSYVPGIYNFPTWSHSAGLGCRTMSPASLTFFCIGESGGWPGRCLEQSPVYKEIKNILSVINFGIRMESMKFHLLEGKIEMWYIWFNCFNLHWVGQDTGYTFHFSSSIPGTPKLSLSLSLPLSSLYLPVSPLAPWLRVTSSLMSQMPLPLAKLSHISIINLFSPLYLGAVISYPFYFTHNK